MLSEQPFLVFFLLFSIFCYSESIKFFIQNFFCWLLFHVVSTPPWLLKFNSLELYPQLLFATYFCPIFYLLNTVSEATIRSLPLTVQNCFIMLRQSSPDTFEPPFPRRWRTSTGVASILRICLCAHT